MNAPKGSWNLKKFFNMTDGEKYGRYKKDSDTVGRES
jgi:hypothetical protein